MADTIAQESRRYFNIIKKDIKNGEENKIPYLSGTSNKRSRMYKEASKYASDAKIDMEMGIITKQEYEIEIKTVRLFEKALANFKTY